MGEFFRGCRRRVGLMTLAMACVVMALWIRSLSTVDDVEYEDLDTVMGTENIELVFVSSNGSLVWFGHRQNASLTPFEAIFTTRLWNVDLASDVSIISFDEYPVKWTFRSLGIEIGVVDVGDQDDHDHEGFWVIPYWLIVLSLSLVSAYLLLSKPHPSTLKKITESIPPEGT